MTDVDVRCHGCGHGYLEHAPDGGHCAAVVAGQLNPRAICGCPCQGFRWVDPDGPGVGSYTDPPRRP